jgi:NADPH:quinone reductase
MTNMKAVLCKSFGPTATLVVEDVAAPVPGPGQVVIDVKAAGANFPDALMVQGKYQLKPPVPFSPGCEAAGIVRIAGEGVKHVKPGDAVVALMPWGAFAEEALVDAGNVMPLPPGADMAAAAALLFAHGTSLHALKDRAQLKAGETLLVLGASGGVGLAAVELGNLMGAHVIAAASTDAKLAVCREHGAESVVNYATESLKDRVRELTQGRGADVVYDPVGGDYSETALRSIARNGRYLVIGFANGEIPRIPLNLPLLKECAIVGVFWGQFMQKEPKANAANLRQLFAWLASGELRPHIFARYPLSGVPEALDALLNRAVSGKIVILPEA